MLLYREKLLSNGQLKRLNEHLYNCENIGLLDKYLQPFWNFLTSKTPLWLAPNVITVSGLLVNILTTLVLVFYSPDARAEVSKYFCSFKNLICFQMCKHIQKKNFILNLIIIVSSMKVIIFHSNIKNRKRKKRVACNLYVFNNGVKFYKYSI